MHGVDLLINCFCFVYSESGLVVLVVVLVVLSDCSGIVWFKDVLSVELGFCI